MSVAADAIVHLIRWYQRHWSAKRAVPCCSHYAIQAVRRYGAFRGGLLAVLRLLRCLPWSCGGIDDVPQRYSIFYRFPWSKAHEEPRLTPLVVDDKENGL